MIKAPNLVIKNDKGEVITLTKREQYHANWIQRQIEDKFKNDLGYEISITTLTTIMKKISQQKFFHIAPAEYLPVVVGEGAWSQQLTTYRSFSLAEDFSTGVINTGSSNDRLAMGDAGVDALNLQVKNWAKGIGWNIFDLEQAAKSGNWDLVSAKEKSRKQNWDLGIQKISFLGLAGSSSVQGLLNVSGTTDNLTLITKAISSMTGTELKAFCLAVLNSYRVNNGRTAMPTHFILPESDYLGLATFTNADFNLRSVLPVLEETFKTMTQNPNFKILPCAYGDVAYNSSVINKQRYVLLNYDEESLRMNIPVDYTNTLANSIDNFSFQNVGYGQFTGVQALRPLELFYMSY